MNGTVVGSFFDENFYIAEVRRNLHWLIGWLTQNALLLDAGCRRIYGIRR